MTEREASIRHQVQAIRSQAAAMLAAADALLDSIPAPQPEPQPEPARRTRRYLGDDDEPGA